MGYKAEGKVEKIFDSETKGASFQVRQFVIEVSDGQYPQMVAFQLVQDKCTLIDDYSEGDMIEVEFDLRGREWNGKYFTNLQAWRIGRAGEGGGESGSNEGQAQSSAQKPAAPPPAASNDFDDDIPF
jgi:single-strand DNA-binding protein